MPYCACLTLHDAAGTSLATRRYGEMPTPGASALLEDQMRTDLLHILRRRPELRICTLADGAAEMQQHLDRVVAGLEVDAQLVDYWHAVEYLGAAAAVIGNDLGRWKERLLERQRAARRIANELHTWLIGVDAPPPAVIDALRYFDNLADRMNYASARTDGLPIGSGCVEATCKTNVATRFKRAGARWTLPEARPSCTCERSLRPGSGLWQLST